MKRLSLLIIAILLVISSYTASAEEVVDNTDILAQTDENNVNDSLQADKNDGNPSEESNSDENGNTDDNNTGNSSDKAEDNKKYAFEFTDIEGAFDAVNVQNYTPEASEKESIYNAERFIRRDGVSGEAYIIYEIPYVTEFYAISCHRPTDVAAFSFEGSKNGEEWTTIHPEIKTVIDESKWTVLECSAESIENIRYIKVIWGEEKESVHWWNPYFVGIFANTGEAVAKEVRIENEEEFYIPMYDSTKLLLEAKILDQIGIEVEGDIIWSLVECSDERLKISMDNEIEISSDMPDGTSITIKAESADGMHATEKTITLKAAMPGDINGDNIITDIDILHIIESYGKTIDSENRLCDVDKNGTIDIIDLAYAARYKQIEEK